MNDSNRNESNHHRHNPRLVITWQLALGFVIGVATVAVVTGTWNPYTLQKADSPVVAVQPEVEKDELEDPFADVESDAAFEKISTEQAAAYLEKAVDLTEAGRHYEAIGLLNQTRWDAPDSAYFEKASDLMIKIKVENGIPLTISEKLKLERDAEAETEAVERAAAYEKEALALAEANKPYEAIALLDHARWDVLTYFDEASGMIIKIKQENNIPLNNSEQLQLERKAETDHQ
jgi:hypothetical protein